MLVAVALMRIVHVGVVLVGSVDSQVRGVPIHIGRRNIVC